METTSRRSPGYRRGTSSVRTQNEALSILENAALMGMPVPSAIKRALDQLKDEE